MRIDKQIKKDIEIPRHTHIHTHTNRYRDNERYKKPDGELMGREVKRGLRPIEI